MKNLYEILQVFPKASQQEIKDAFRFLLFRYHPDHNKGREDWAVERTMELVEAYHVLADGGRRAHYDVMRTLKPRDEMPKKGFSLFGKGNEKAKEAEAVFKEGVEQYRRDEYEQAIGSFRKALDLDGEFPHTRYNLGLCFLAILRLNEAVQWFQQHLAKFKEDADARALVQKIMALGPKMKGAKAG